MANFYINHLIETFNAKNSLFNSYELSKENMVVFRWNGGDNLNDINIYVSVSTLESGAVMATISCYDFPNFSNHYAKGVLACNQLNNDELVRYFIDDEGDAGASLSILFNAYGVPSNFYPEQVLITAAMMALSADDAYAVFEKAKWAN